VRNWVIPVLACLLAATAARATTVTDLYKAQTYVTGQSNLPERQRGFRDALSEVLVKLTGDIGIKSDPRLQQALAGVESYVVRFEYEDRMKGIPIHDEQGTRDRPFFLRVWLDPVKTDALVASLGRRKWSAERPSLLVLVAVRDLAGHYLLDQQVERGYGQREAFRSTADRFGLPILLPAGSGDPAKVTYADVAAPQLPAIAAAKAAFRADALLRGTMTVNAKGYWSTGWTLDHGGARKSWHVDNTTFDRAIARSMATVARTLAGLN